VERGRIFDVTSRYEGDKSTTAKPVEGPAEDHNAREDQAFANKLAKRSPPNAVELAAIDRATKRTKARAPRIAVHLEDRGAGALMYPGHSDDTGHRYRLADAFGTRSLQFVYAMLRGIGKATEDHSEDKGFRPGSPDQLAFNAALAVIDGVRPKDEVEAMLAAHMAVTNIALLELVAHMRKAAAGHLYQGNGGIKRLEVFGSLTTKFMRTYTTQVEALTRKRRKGEQSVTVKYVHVHPGGQAIVGNVNHRNGRGVAKNDHRPHGRSQRASATGAIPKRPPMRRPDQERKAMPVARDRKRAVSTARRGKR
jgi:hypothetical protein